MPALDQAPRIEVARPMPYLLGLCRKFWIIALLQPQKKPKALKGLVGLYGPSWTIEMVEVAGIEPASEGTPSPVLHA